MKNLIIALVLFLSLSCQQQRRQQITMTMEGANDSCYELRDKSGRPIAVERRMEILQNTLSDTVSLGFAILPPGYVGEFLYLRAGDSKDAGFDPEDPNRLPKTPMLCIERYQDKTVSGTITVLLND